MGDAVLEDDDVGVGSARGSEPRRDVGGLVGLGAEQDQVERARDRKGVGQHRHLALDSLLVEFDGDRVEWRAGGDRKRHFGALQDGARDGESDRPRTDEQHASFDVVPPRRTDVEMPDVRGRHAKR